MTVNYTLTVSNANLWTFVKALFHWRGSLWKAVWELVAWCLAYTALSICYRLAMNKSQQTVFEAVCILCNKYVDFLPLSFILGFYVTQVVSRWTTIYSNMGWCDNYSLYTTSYMFGKDERTRTLKRAVARYMSLLQIVVYRDISLRVRKRFPTLDTLITAKVLTEEEKKQLESATGTHSKYYMPVMWAMQVVRTARDEGLILSDFALSDIYRNLMTLYEKQFTLVMFDWVPLPLLYAQVVGLAVRIYFVVCLLGRQYIISDTTTIDAYVPFHTIFQFVFYLGWLKVADALLNPFGEDDDDYESNWIIDRNMATSVKIMDSTEGGEGDVRICKDKFWNDPAPVPMYSTLFVPERKPEPQGSAVDRLKIPKDVVMLPRSEAANSRKPSWLMTSIATIASSMNLARLRKPSSAVATKRAESSPPPTPSSIGSGPGSNGKSATGSPPSFFANGHSAAFLSDRSLDQPVLLSTRSKSESEEQPKQGKLLRKNARVIDLKDPPQKFDISE